MEWMEQNSIQRNTGLSRTLISWNPAKSLCIKGKTVDLKEITRSMKARLQGEKVEGRISSNVKEYAEHSAPCWLSCEAWLLWWGWTVMAADMRVWISDKGGEKLCTGHLRSINRQNDPHAQHFKTPNCGWKGAAITMIKLQAHQLHGQNKTRKKREIYGGDIALWPLLIKLYYLWEMRFYFLSCLGGGDRVVRVNKRFCFAVQSASLR